SSPSSPLGSHTAHSYIGRAVGRGSRRSRGSPAPRTDPPAARTERTPSPGPPAAQPHGNPRRPHAPAPGNLHRQQQREREREREGEREGGGGRDSQGGGEGEATVCAGEH